MYYLMLPHAVWGVAYVVTYGLCGWAVGVVASNSPFYCRGS